jgi:hypothetical protein
MGTAILIDGAFFLKRFRALFDAQLGRVRTPPGEPRDLNHASLATRQTPLRPPGMACLAS